MAGRIIPVQTCKTTITPLKVQFWPEFNQAARILAEIQLKTFLIWLDLPSLENNNAVLLWIGNRGSPVVGGYNPYYYQVSYSMSFTV